MMFSDRLGKCQVCESEAAKYTCPGCETRTCSLQCVKSHKTELKCDGLRNKTAYKPVSQFSNLDFLSDYRLLEDISQSVDTFARDQNKRYTRSGGDLPNHLFKLREAAHVRSMRLWFLPQNFTRHKNNTTYLDWRTRVVSWKIQWMFPDAEDSKIQVDDKRVCETAILKDCVLSKIDENANLARYQEAGFDNIAVLLRAENRTKASTTYFSFDMDKSLKDNLHGHTLVEYPVLYVVLKSSLTNYTIISLETEKNTSTNGITSCNKKRSTGEPLPSSSGADVRTPDVSKVKIEDISDVKKEVSTEPTKELHEEAKRQKLDTL